MNKELTPLEALSDLKEVSGWNKEELNKRLSIIETALKAFEIIKEKRVDPFNEIIETEDYEDYLSWYDINRFYTLTKEEYDLLKEVLKK